MSLIDKESITNFWWDCPSCGQTKISSVLHEDERTYDSAILGARLHCPSCFYVMKGDEPSYVDETVYEIPAEWVERLEKPRWKCQQCGALNEAHEVASADDLYCHACETWQCDIPDTPTYDPEAVLKREKYVEAKSRFENPITPIELIQDKAAQQGTRKKQTQKKQDKSPSGTLSNLQKLLIAGILVSGFGLWLFDGSRIRTIDASFTHPSASVTVEVQNYQIVQKEGWDPAVSAPEYSLIDSYKKQRGTRQVLDHVETYFEDEQYIARYETETYTDTVTEREQTGTRQECETVKSGATARTKCRDVPVYSTVSKEVTKTRDVPVYATRQVERQRNIYRTEPVFDMWYVWKQREWVHHETLSAFSNTFEIQYPDTTPYAERPNFRVQAPQLSCRVTIVPIQTTIAPQEKPLDCEQFQTLLGNPQGRVSYSKWRGIEAIEVQQ